MIEFLSAQTIVKTPDSASINPSDNYLQPSNDIDKSNNDEVSLEKLSYEGAAKEVIIIGSSILNNVNSRGLSKS